MNTDDSFHNHLPGHTHDVQSVRTLVRRAIDSGCFIDFSLDERFALNEEWMWFEAIVAGRGRLLVEVSAEGNGCWRAAASWVPWDEWVSGRGRMASWVQGDVWPQLEDAVVEVLVGIAPGAGMTALDLLRLREPSYAELVARDHTIRWCSGGRLSLLDARRLAAERHGWLGWDDMLDDKRRRRLPVG
jgi:hypothetical protein